MAIKIRCTQCRGYSDVKAKICRSCSAPLPKQGKRYRVDVVVNGQRVFKFTHSLKLAREFESTLRADMQRDEFDIKAHKKKKVITLNEVWERYITLKESERPKSAKTDKFFYTKHLQPRFGNRPMDKISAFDIEGMKKQMREQVTPQGKEGYSDATIRHQLILLGSLFNKAREWGVYKGDNPLKSVKKPKLNNEVTEFMTDDEMQRLLDTLDTWPCRTSANLVLIGLFTGIRKGEILKLRWDRVDLARKTVTLVDPKGGKDVTIPISEAAVHVFGQIERTSEYVIPGPDGGMKKTFRDPWYRIREAAGLPASYRFHGLRHNLASQLVSNGVDLHVVKTLLTHKDARTTERYAHLSDARLREVAEKGGRLITGAKKRADVIELTS